MASGRERDCWHGVCPYKTAFDPDEGEEIAHDPYELLRLVEFCQFCMEISDVADPNAPPPKNGHKAKTVKRHSLSLEKFGLALTLWGIENPEHKREALRYAGEYVRAAEGAKDRAMRKQREQAAKRHK